MGYFELNDGEVSGVVVDRLLTVIPDIPRDVIEEASLAVSNREGGSLRTALGKLADIPKVVTVTPRSTTILLRTALGPIQFGYRHDDGHLSLYVDDSQWPSPAAYFQLMCAAGSAYPAAPTEVAKAVKIAAEVYVDHLFNPVRAKAGGGPTSTSPHPE